MAKAKSVSTKAVKKQSIADAAKEAYLKTHTKEEMYKAYDDLHNLQRGLSTDMVRLETKLFDYKERIDNLTESNDMFEQELYWRKKDITALRITIAMLCAGLLLVMLIK